MKSLKFLLLLIALFTLVQAAVAQSYYQHKLENGETLSALAKQYGTTVGDIMRLNDMHADSKLVYGSSIKIPVAEVQEVNKPVAPAAKPSSATHTVEQGETLYSISKKYNVSMDQIRSLNNLPDNNVQLGSVLVLSAGAQTASTTGTSVEKKPITSEQQPVSKPASTNTPEKLETAATLPPGNKLEEASTPPEETPELTASGEGYFAQQFKAGSKLATVNGTSMTFKTSSGWSDGKYYILMNEADPGSIVKIEADNGKSIYAKVLWNMTDMKENTGVNFRISTAAAAALGIDSSKFNISVKYTN